MNQKAILITGASRGIGKDLAYIFAKEGFNLYLCCRKSEKEMDELKSNLEKEYGIWVCSFICNLSSYESILEMTDYIKKQGGVYGIVNNAGISYVGLMTDMSDSEWMNVMDVNLNSAFRICHELIPGMVSKKEGKIVNVSSVWGNVGASMEVAYSASKGGINAFTRALAKELAPSNIQVNAVAFGCIDTDMMKCFSKEDIAALKEEIPADRIGTSLEAAEMVYNIFTSPDYLTGQIITMDGGWI